MTEHLMPRTLCAWIVFGLGVPALLFFQNPAGAQTVWSGLTFRFSKSDAADPTLPENQDRITSNVWITRRATFQGLVNAKTECGLSDCTYMHNFSPADTAWATAGMPANTGKTIAATNWQNLSFTNWEVAYGNHVGGNILTPTYRDAVVHLITDNIYLDLRFTDWTGSGGGGFAYQRATAFAPPMPSGDYNHNGVVDGADYVVWRDTLGQAASPAGSGADGDQSAMIDSGDYTYWRQRFGNTVPGAGSGSAQLSVRGVPEPASSTLVCFCLNLLASRRLVLRGTENRN